MAVNYEVAFGPFYMQELRAHYKRVKANMLLPPRVPVVCDPVFYQESFGPWRTERNPLDLLIDSICIKHKILPSDLTGTSRKHRYVRPRHEFWYELCLQYNWSLNRIGKKIGFDHTTILSGIRKHCKINGLDLPPGLAARRCNKVMEFKIPDELECSADQNITLPGLAPRFTVLDDPHA